MFSMNSIAKKTSLTLAILTLIILVVMGIFNYMNQSGRYNKNWQDNRVTLDGQMRVILQEPLYSYNKELVQNIIESFVKSHIVEGITVYDQRKKKLASAGSNHSGHSDILEKHSLEIKWTDGQKIGVINVTFSKEYLAQSLSDTRNFTGVSMLITLFLLAVACYVALNRIVVAPLNKVTLLLEDIGKGGGDLTQRLSVDSDDELGRLSKGFNDFISKIQKIVQDLANSAENLIEVSATVERTSDRTKSESHKQKEQTLQALDYLQGVSEVTLEIARLALETADETRDMQETSNEGREDMKTNLDQVSDLVNELDNTTVIVTKLKESSDNIGSVLDVIKSIAEQTNLLALNAAIEAARAGESGRGFAVVADEVRALASKTHKSTSEIETIIESLQTLAIASYDATERSKKMAAVAINSTRSSYESLDALADKMGKINEMNTTIANSSEKQNSVTSEVTRSMEKIQHGAENLNQEAIDLSVAVERLAQVEESLKSELEQFKY
jgi:methyl-accepting chemotaxis protein